MTKEKVEGIPNVVTGKFSTRTHPVGVLFDSSVTHSFISTRWVEALGLVSTSKHSPLCITLPDGKELSCKELFIDCPIQIHSNESLAILYKFKLIEFDAILGVD